MTANRLVCAFSLDRSPVIFLQTFFFIIQVQAEKRGAHFAKGRGDERVPLLDLILKSLFLVA